MCMVFVSVTIAFADLNAKIDSSLLKEFDTRQKDISIAIWFKEPDISIAKNTALKQVGLSENEFLNISNSNLTQKEKLHIVQTELYFERKKLYEIFSTYNNKMAETLSSGIKVDYISKYAPVINATANKSAIYNLCRNSNVEKIYLLDESKVQETLDISTKTIKSYFINNASTDKYTGSGIKIGIFDGSLPDNSLVGLPSSRFHVDPQAVSNNGTHGTLIALIIAGQGLNSSTKGVAPDASLYCTCGRSFSSSMDWMVSNGVNIVNMSLIYTGEPNHNTYSSIDKYADYISYVSNLTIVNAPGNYGMNGVYSPGMGYNVITVGNLDDNNTFSGTDDKLAPSSSYYNNTSTSIVSKPDICAPGTNITTRLGTSSGTSCSAPHVTGALALMAQQDSTVMYVPYAFKAIITAGVNKHFHHYVPSQRILSTNNNNPANSYVQYGAGILDCYNNYKILYNYQYDFGCFLSHVSTGTQTIYCTKDKMMRVSMVAPNQRENQNDNAIYTANFDLQQRETMLKLWNLLRQYPAIIRYILQETVY